MKLTNITEHIPTAGGGAAGLTVAKITMEAIPSPDVIIFTVILAIIGSGVGYSVKLLIDRLRRNK